MRNTTTPTQTITRAGISLAAIPLLVLGLAACSSGNSDSSGSSGGKNSSSMSEADKKTAAHEYDLALAKCVRDKGFDAPDPDAGGGQAISIGDGQDVDALIAANKSCAMSVEKKLGKRPVTAAEQQANEAAEQEGKKREACLKEKGYDLSSGSSGSEDLGGGASISSSTGGVDIPDDVMKACGLGDGSSGSTITGR